jgi:hypothetical protein
MIEVGEMHGRCKIPATLAVLVAASLGACSQSPTAVSFPREEQARMQSVNHWSQFAHTDTDRIAKALKATGDTQICIADPAVKTTFNEGFISYLGVYLHQQGLDLVACGGDVPVVMLTTQVVAHLADRRRMPTDTELVVTTRVQKSSADIAMFADSFFVNNEDWRQYTPPVQQATLRRLPNDRGTPGLCHTC